MSGCKMQSELEKRSRSPREEEEEEEGFECREGTDGRMARLSIRPGLKKGQSLKPELSLSKESWAG